MGTQSIGRALATAESVVIGRVRERAAPVYLSDDRRPAAIVVDVVQSLKGGVTGKIEIAESLMCYQSFNSKDFKVGMSYVFPLTQVDWTNPGDTFDLGVETGSPYATRYQMYRLPTCSHTALLLSGERLYTNELTAGVGRRLEPYMTLGFLKLLFATGLVGVWRYVGFVAILMAICAAFVFARKRRATGGHED